MDSMKYPNAFRFCACLILAAIWLLPAFSAENDQAAKLEREIEDNLIAPCCWSQPVSQHYSEASDKIREEVHAMVAAGKSRDEILNHYVAQYGDRILAAPRVKGFNLLAYVLPWAALLLGGWMLIVLLRKLRKPAPVTIPAPIPDARYSAAVEKEIKELEE
jgi:cytochrome c-type biogenesis protein CcmH